jgi:hypothetical protein
LRERCDWRRGSAGDKCDELAPVHMAPLNARLSKIEA